MEVPENIGEIRNLFHNHPTVEQDPPPYSSGHEEGIVGMLKDELGFGDGRITKAIERLSSANRLKSSSKPTLFDF